MTNIGGEGIGLWDEEDQFFYDELNLSDRSIILLKVRSMVGLILLFAVETLEPDLLAELPEFRERLEDPEQPAGPGAVGLALAGARARRSPSFVAAARPSHEDALAAYARRGRVPFGLRRARGLEVSRGPPVRVQL